MPPRLSAFLLAAAIAGPAVAADFQANGLGFVRKHCLACHGEKVQKADLALHVYRDEDSVLKQRKVWQNVLKMVQGGEMPPKGRPRPAAADIEAFSLAINLVFVTADRNLKTDPGQVTIRRLNRTEYNNTIRDLVGIDFNPAEDFPSDDIGHGFDNIGDVLSLSPVLMERYLAAAESIVQRAIVSELPKPPQRRQASRWLEPATSQAFHWRPLADKGSFHTPWRLNLGGEFVFRVRAYAETPNGEPVRIALTANGKELKTFEVKATQKKPESYEARVTLPAGDTRFAAVLLNPTTGDKKRTLYVEYFELIGPADTRPATQKRLLECSPDKPKREQTRQVLMRFASKAYRRPATPDEVERLARLVEAAEARGDRWEAALQLAFQAVLVSPKFLFRVELDDRPDSPQPHPIDEYQLAARLSYFLWSTLPDDELVALAEKKTLTANLDVQVRRMLKDPKSRALVDNFALQWLQLQRLKAFAPDSKLFPNFDDSLRAAMLEETRRFFEAVVQEDRSILELIDADFTFLNERLARHYGIVDTAGTRAGQKPKQAGARPIQGPQFVRVRLGDGERGGLLTQASVLTVTSNPTRTSPVKRGRWVLEQILGTPPPPPPPNVPELEETGKAALSGTLRQRMEQHRANPSCANCHARMDPIGFAFENFNAIGAFRNKDGDFAIDPSGTLPDGKSFRGPAELKAVLKGKKDQFSQCLTEKLLIYALGRGLEYYDRPALERIQAGLAGNEYRFSTLAIAIARSDPFRLRRGKDDVK